MLIINIKPGDGSVSGSWFGHLPRGLLKLQFYVHGSGTSSLSAGGGNTGDSQLSALALHVDTNNVCAY